MDTTRTLQPGTLNSLSRKDVGAYGENIAAAYLESLGWVIHTRNFRTRYGEVDIVASDRHTLVFVEVKTRRTRTFGPGIHAVTPGKLTHVRRVMGEYLLDHAPRHRDVRIDALDIQLTEGHDPAIEHYRSVTP